MHPHVPYPPHPSHGMPTKLTRQQAVQQLSQAMQAGGGHAPPGYVAAPPNANLAPLLQHAQQAAKAHVQGQLHATAPPVTAPATAYTPAPAHAPPPAPTVPPPLPPMLDSIETDGGIYVDDTEFDLAQGRVKRWLELDAEIATLSAALRERRKQREDLNKHIIAFMQGNQVPHFEMSRGNLSLQVSKHKQPLNQKWIASRIQAVEGIPEDKQQELMRVICEEREVTERTRLKHQKSRGKAGKAGKGAGQAES